MTKVDWSKVVGCYAFGVALTPLFGVALRGAPFDGPLSTGAVAVPAMIAANLVARIHGPARPLPWRLLAVTIGVITFLQAVTLAVGQATFGWQGGWKDNVAFATFSAVGYPFGLAWLHGRTARPSGPAADPDARTAV